MNELMNEIYIARIKAYKCMLYLLRLQLTIPIPYVCNIYRLSLNKLHLQCSSNSSSSSSSSDSATATSLADTPSSVRPLQEDQRTLMYPLMCLYLLSV